MPLNTLFLNAHKTFSKTNHVLGLLINFNKLTRIYIIQNVFFGHNRKELETYKRNISRK